MSGPYQSGPVGQDHRLDTVAQVELGEDARDVGLHGLMADHEFGGDLGVGPTVRDQDEDLALPGRQQLEKSC